MQNITRTYHRPRVQVLMAIYNGLLYLPVQIKSLLDQTDVRVEIIIQDDGSTDGTREYAQGLLSQGKVSSLTTSENIGSTDVFLELIQKAKKSDFYAFSDQDDIWDSNKLKLLTDELKNDSPAMIFCKRRFWFSQVKVVQAKKISRERIGIKNALIENAAPGNTVILNEKAMRLLKKIDFKGVRHFDSAIYLFFSSLENVNFLNLELMSYRIHERNQIGLGNKRIYKLLRVKSALIDFYINAQVLKKNSRLITKESLNCIDTFLLLSTEKNIIKRFYILKNLKLVRQSFIETIFFNLYLLFRGRI